MMNVLFAMEVFGSVEHRAGRRDGESYCKHDEGANVLYQPLS